MEAKNPIFIHGANAQTLASLYEAALLEVINAINRRLAEGQEPKRTGRPTISIRDNGMPSISDAPFMGGNGPLEYGSVLEPSKRDGESRSGHKFPDANFPALASLRKFISDRPDVQAAYMEKPFDRLLRILVDGGVEDAANEHFLRYGEVASDCRTRTAVLRPVLRAFTAENLSTPVVIPIALTRFTFDRVRLAKDAILLRMSPQLQQARWYGKARSANGHDAVLASATHALVLTDWSVPNDAKWKLSETLSRNEPKVTFEIETFFAALRLELGIETGYAQEIRLGRGWRSFARLAEPEAHAVGARRYPSWFDDYGWNADPLPEVHLASMKAVASTWGALRAIRDDRLALALRRLNAAMTRDEPADAILDATIALEVLLGDGDSQSISWKLRMRAAAIIGLDADRTRMEDMLRGIKDTYDARSAIVHGSRRRSSPVSDPHAASRRAIDVLREVMKALLAHPEYLDPQKIDGDLLLNPRVPPSDFP
jgi:hypothetical protein